MFRVNQFKMNEVSDGAAGGTPAAGNHVATGVVDVQNIAGGGTPEPTGTPAPDAGGNVSWLESLPEDIRKDPALAMFKGPDALAKSWISAQKMIGADKVVIPGEKATDEERSAFYNKIGRPDAPEKYELPKIEGYDIDDASAKGFKDAAFKMGLTASQAKSMIDFDAQRVKAFQDSAAANQQAQITANLQEYAKTLGSDEKYKAKVDEARLAVSQLATPELKKFLVDSKMGSHPQMIEFFAGLKGMMADGKLRDGTGVGFGVDPATIQAEITELEKPGGAVWDSSHAGHEMAVQNRNKLYERLHAAQNGRQM